MSIECEDVFIVVGLPYLVNAFLSVFSKTKIEVFPRIPVSVLETPFAFVLM
jgi:hypothetical protein